MNTNKLFSILTVVVLLLALSGVGCKSSPAGVPVGSQGAVGIQFMPGGNELRINDGAKITLQSGAVITASSGSELTLSGPVTMTSPVLTGDVTFTGTFKNTDVPMTGSATRPLDFRSSPTTTSYLNTTLAYFRADLDKNLNESVAGEDGFTVGMFRGYVGATSLQGAIVEGLRAGVNLDAGASVNDPAGAGYIAGARVTTYVPATANAKTNKGLIVAPRDDTAEGAISGSQYIGEQIYLKQGVAKSESWGLDIYTEPGCATMDAAINLRNGSTEIYNYGIDMNAMTAPGTADIRLSNGNVIVATEGQVVYNTIHDVSAAEINAGHVIVTVPSDLSVRVTDVTAIAIGGNCGTVTTVDLLSGADKLFTYGQANLTRSTPLTTDATGVTILADGASFASQGPGVDLAVGKTGGAVDTCTYVRFILSYVLD